MDRDAVFDQRLVELGLTRSDLVDALQLPPGGCMVAYASLLEGLGTSLSDVDLYVIWPTQATAALGPDRTVVVRRGDISLDTEYWPEESIRAAMAQLAEEPIVPGNWTIGMLKTLHRMVSGVCLAGSEYRNRLTESIPSRRVNRVLADWYLWRYDGDFEDTAALYEAGDWRSACLIAHSMLQAAAGVVTARRGCPIFKEKWLYRGLLQAFGVEHPVVQRYWALQALVDGSNLARHVADMLDYGSQLVTMSVDGGDGPR